MKAWNFKVMSNPKETSKKLESSLGDANNFVLKMNSNRKDLVKFKIRKRVSITFDNNSQNKIIVNGKIFKADTANESEVEISFTQHPLMKLIHYGLIILALGLMAAMILKSSSNMYLLIVAGIILLIVISLGIQGQREFNKNVQEYRTLISGILEI